MSTKKPLIIITGPTAVGKTSTSIELAQRIGGEIISADSMQVYKKMDIGTAKIMPEEMNGVPHYLIDELSPSEPFDVFRFQQMGKEALNQIYQKGKIPIVVGGTGFYIQALLYDIDFSKEHTSNQYREQLEKIAKEKGEIYLFNQLKEVDPVSAQIIHPNNVKRVIRALEYYEENQVPISEHNKEQQEKESPYNFLYFVLTMNRAKLYNRINYRVKQMFEMGLLEEMELLIQDGYTRDLVSMQAIGYKELFDYFDGNISKEFACEQIQKDTRHFAKRQLTWFRREKNVTFLDKDLYNNESAIVDDMIRMIEEKNMLVRE